MYLDTQQTYYLRKPYLNADPTSAFLDWCSINSTETMESVVERNHIEYLFVDKDDVARSGCASNAIRLLASSGALQEIWTRQTGLTQSRIKGTFTEHTVGLFKWVRPMQRRA